MNAYRKIKFHTPGQIAAGIAGFIGMYLAMLVIMILCI